MPEQGAVILAANHMSNWDPPLLASFLIRPVTYMAKQELFEIPVFGAAIRACNAFPVKRGAADRGAIKAALQALKQGRCLGLFPEGTRSKDGTIGAFKAGALQLAIEAGVPVLPVAIEGAGSVLPPSGFSVRPGQIVVRFGDPIETTGMTPQDRNALARQARDAVLALRGR